MRWIPLLALLFVCKPLATAGPRLTNLSTRGWVGSADRQLVCGLVFSGDGKDVLVRAAGPALGQFGLGNLLPNPELALWPAGGNLALAANDDWDPGLATVFSTLGAFSFQSSKLDAALFQSLPGGSYTPVIRDRQDREGLAIVELYDATPTQGELVNLSARAWSGTGDRVLIPGFTIDGPGSMRVLLRAVGPGLATWFPRTYLPNPRLELRDSDNKLIASNDDWNSQDLALVADMARVGAFPLNAVSRDAALSVTLPAGGYTLVVKDADGREGVAIAEIYRIESSDTYSPPVVNGDEAELCFLPQQPIYAARAGIGTNVTSISSSITVERFGGKFGSAYCRLPEASDTRRWGQITDALRWSGLDWTRLLVEMNDFAPEANQRTWDSPNLLRAKRVLDWAQSQHVDVLLQLQGHATTWNSIAGQDPAYSAPRDVKAFAEAYTDLVERLVRTEGYTCIKMLNIANEPMNPWGWWRGGDIAEGYRLTRESLDARGISLPLVGTEYFHESNFNANWEASRPYLGGWENHNYDVDEGTGNTFAPRPLRDPNYPVYWGEFGGADNTNYSWALITARWQLGGFSNGVDGFARWSFLNQNDIDGDFSYLRTWDVARKALLDNFTLTPNLYATQALLSRYTAKSSWAYATATTRADLTPALLRSPNGNWTAAVVNTGTQAAATVWRFPGWTESRTLYRYQITPAHLNRTDRFLASTKEVSLSPQNASFKETVPAQSLTVYSTFALNLNDDGIVDDGAWQPLPAATPLNGHRLVWDDRDTALSVSSGWAQGADTAHHAGTYRYTQQAGASVSFRARTTRFRLYGHQDNGSGLASVTIDGNWVGYASAYAPLDRQGAVLFDSGPLSDTEHDVQIVVLGRGTTTSQGAYFNLDAVGLE